MTTLYASRRLVVVVAWLWTLLRMVPAWSPPGASHRRTTTITTTTLYAETALERMAREWQSSSNPKNGEASTPATTTLYERRTTRVAGSIQAGTSRWGTMENQLCSLLASRWNPTQYAANDWQQAQSSQSSSAADWYEQRTQQVAQAAQVGKSRWGSMENQRATMTVQGETTTSSLPSSSLYEQRNRQVTATAQAGKSRWGRMENDRASAVGGTPMPKGSRQPPRPSARPQGSTRPASALYQKRSQRVMGAAAAGKSRWGSTHVEKVQTAVGLQQALTTLSQGIPPAAEAPVSPPPAATASSSSFSPSLYDQRNAKVIAAAQAGQSRWGTMENENAKMSLGLRQALDRIGPGMENTRAGQGGGVSKGSSSTPDTSLYDVRSQKVVQAAAAGTSRWGSMYLEKLSNAAGLQQALHTLEDGIPPATSVPPPPPASPVATPTPSKGSLYDQRNERLAAAAQKGQSRWGTMETEKAAMSAGLKQAFDFLGGKPMEPLSSPSTSTTPTERTKVEPVDNIMAQISQEWQAANPDSGATPASASPWSPPPPEVPPPPVEPSSGTSGVTMDQLAREWAAMNSAHDTSSASAPSLDMYGAPQTISQPPPPPPPPQTSSTTPSFPAVPPAPIAMPPPPASQAQTNWAVATAPPPPQQTVVETASSGGTAAAGMLSDWERLAQEWMQTNSDKDV